MATAKLIRTINEIKNINLPFKFLIKREKKRIINKAIIYLQNFYLKDNYFSATHIIHLCKLLDSARVMGFLEDNEYAKDNHIVTGGIEIDIFCSDNSAVIKINASTQELIFSATDSIKVEHIDNRDPEHSYRFNYVYDTIDRDTKNQWKNGEEMIRAYSYELLYIAFNLILQIVFNALYEKEI